MNKSVGIHIVIMIIAVIAGSFIAQEVYKKQIVLMPEMNNLNNAPIGGMHKIASDAEWMRFINYCGSQDSINKENVDEVIKRLDRLISLDPNFEKAYSVGVQMVAVQKPEKAIEFLVKACDNKYLSKNWKIPFYAAFIMNHHCKPARVKESVEYYEKAVKRAGNPEKFLINAWIRARAKAALEDQESFLNDKGSKLVNVDDAILNELYQEWKKSGSGEMEDVVEGDMYSLIPDLNERILEAAKKAKENAKGNKTVLKHVDQVRKEVLKGRDLERKFMTAAEVAQLPPEELKGGAELSATFKAQLKAMEDAALKRIKDAEEAALKRINEAAAKAAAK